MNSDQCDSPAVVILKDHPMILKSTKFLGMITNRASWPLFRDFDLATLCQTSASFMSPFCPETFTAIEVVPLPLLASYNVKSQLIFMTLLCLQSHTRETPANEYQLTIKQSFTSVIWSLNHSLFFSPANQSRVYLTQNITQMALIECLLPLEISQVKLTSFVLLSVLSSKLP